MLDALPYDMLCHGNHHEKSEETPASQCFESFLTLFVKNTTIYSYAVNPRFLLFRSM